jgi:hypothetical protein
MAAKTDPAPADSANGKSAIMLAVRWLLVEANTSESAC